MKDRFLTSRHLIAMALLVMAVPAANAATELSFANPPVIVDGNGTDTGSVGTTATWANVGTLNGTDIDLVVEVLSNNRTGDSMRFTTDGDDAAVWLDAASGQIVELDYNFYEAGTSTPLTIIPEGLFQDLDANVAGTATLEIVRVLTSQIASYTVEANGLGSDLTVTTLDNGTPGDTSDDEFEVTSGASGNPGDTNISIEFDFQPLSSIRVTLETANGGSGRRYSFDGNAENFFVTRDENPQDVTPPATPTVDLLTTNDATPTLTGTAEAFSTVTAVVGGATFEVVAESDATWSLDTGTVTPQLGVFNPNIDGSAANEVAVTSTDAAGNSTADATGNELVIDATAPVVTIGTVDVVNAANEDNYSVSGNCADGDGVVTVSIAGAAPASLTPACVGGAWTVSGFDVSAIADGTNAIVIDASQTDSFGNTGNAATVQADKDSTPPGTPTVDAQVTNDTTPVITGSADAGVTVSVSVGGALYSVVAGVSGQWTLDTETATPDSGSFNPNTNGVNTVTATVTDAAGNSSTDVTNNELIIDTTVPAVPTVDALVTNDATPAVTGTAEAGSSNTIVFGGAIYTVIADGSGIWTLDTGVATPDSGTFNPNLNGVNDVSVVSSDAAGNTTSDASSDEISIDTTAPVVTITTAPVANSSTASTYVVGGNCASAEGDVTVSLIGATPASQAVSCTAGAWTATFDVSVLADGDDVLQIDASQTDAVGNVGNAGQLSDKDTGAPTIAITNDGSGGDGIVNVAEQSAVVVSGTTDAEDGQTVTVTFSDAANPDVVVTGTATGGAWTASAADVSGLNEGPISITADVDDAAGNAATTAIDTFALDSGLPDLAVDAIGTTNNVFPIFSGTTDQPAGSVVTVRDEVAAVVCTATIVAGSPDNTWSCVPATAIPVGTYTYTAEVDDGTGNVRVVNIDFTIDLDRDDDGIPDAVEGVGDTDGDGTPDYLDTDSDNDGIPDSEEESRVPPLSGVDSDGDGIDDVLDVDQTGGADQNGDGVDDALAPSDLDGDGVPDHLDADTDADGIADIIEGNRDTDNDGIPDYRDDDSDNDGILDALEDDTSPPLAGSDADADGIDDALDVDVTGGTDANNDGIDDLREPTDSDGDGIADYRDRDSDNDRIPDAIEANDVPGGTVLDTDGDGVADYRDPDADNDGISDLAEGRTSGNDADNDGIDDDFDVDQTGGTDADGDGVDDAVFAADFDGDGVPNYLDLDSDNDSILDVIEGGLTDDDDDGLVDDGALTDTPPNTDGVDGPDFIDVDSNNDGTNDIDGTDAAGLDVDGDGQIDAGSAADSDGDGIADVIDDDPTRHGSGDDADGDSVPDSIDLDDDNDGIPDAQETDNGVDVDTDMDGIVDRLDLDTDNDGLPDSVEGVGNNSLDADGDGVLDDLTDSNADGLADQVSTSMVPVDTDGDGDADFRDIDSDGDGINDLTEAGGVDVDGDGRIDDTTDTDGDGLADIVDPEVSTGGGVSLTPPDTDGDGMTDQIDTDSDNDGIGDGDENGDLDGDGVNDRLQNDGPLETAVNGAGSTLWLPFVILAVILISMVRKAARFTLPVLVALLVVPVGSANADESVELPWHVGIGFGVSVADPEGESNGWRTVDDSSNGFKARIGYRFKPQWYAEVSYVDAGGAKIGNLNPAITDIAEIDYRIPAVFVAYTLREPARAWNVHVKLGISAISNSSNDSRVRYDEQSSAQIALGIAAHWNVTSHWFVALEHDQYDRDASFTSVNLGRRFEF